MAITHRALVLFMIMILGAAGAYSYFALGRAEDPSFTIKDHGGERLLQGARIGDASASGRQDREEAAGAALSRPDRKLRPAGIAFIQITLRDTTPPAKVKDSGTRCARR